VTTLTRRGGRGSYLAVRREAGPLRRAGAEKCRKKRPKGEESIPSSGAEAHSRRDYYHAVARGREIAP